MKCPTTVITSASLFLPQFAQCAPQIPYLLCTDNSQKYQDTIRVLQQWDKFTCTSKLEYID